MRLLARAWEAQNGTLSAEDGAMEGTALAARASHSTRSALWS